jgi:hypothetical protein
MTCCFVIKAIFGHNYTQWATCFGENPTSCVKTSEDVRPTIFEHAYHRSDSHIRAKDPPHALRILSKLIHNLQICLHLMPLQPGE